MPIKTKPYVGITGLTSIDEVRHTISISEKYGFTSRSQYVPMLGFLVCSNTLNHGFENRRYPEIGALSKLLAEAKGKAFTAIHYGTKSPEKLSEEIRHIFELDNIYADGLCRGVQLNMTWPSSSEIRKVKDNYPEMKIIMQLSPRATESMSVSQIADKIASSYRNVDYLLIDPSEGRGIEFNPSKSASVYNEIRKKGILAELGFAGGLKGDNVEKKIKDLKDILGEQKFSIDAEGGLRTKLGEGFGNDSLDLVKVEEYIKGASRALFP